MYACSELEHNAEHYLDISASSAGGERVMHEDVSSPSKVPVRGAGGGGAARVHFSAVDEREWRTMDVRISGESNDSFTGLFPKVPKFCSWCGAELKSSHDTRFCSSCGNQV